MVQAQPPPTIPDQVRQVPAGLGIDPAPGEPAINADWGEPGPSPVERVIAWNTLEVLAYRTGNPDHPVNALPAAARATMPMRFVVGTDTARLREHVQRHLAAHGFGAVEVGAPVITPATRLDPDNPWVQFTLDSLQRSSGKAAVLLPNLGGSLPNDVFAELLGLPTVWVPHSYPACNQHAPDEHLPAPVAHEALELMTGLFWDLGEQGARMPRLGKQIVPATGYDRASPDA
jgi:acetylornithine deacetylase/succinyl-diaminopimelate desuccinylase-like protein